MCNEYETIQTVEEIDVNIVSRKFCKRHNFIKKFYFTHRCLYRFMLIYILLPHEIAHSLPSFHLSFCAPTTKHFVIFSFRLKTVRVVQFETKCHFIILISLKFQLKKCICSLSHVKCSQFTHDR